MKLLIKMFVFLIVIGVLSICFLMIQQSQPENNKNKLINHSSTMNIKVNKKFKKENNKIPYFLEVQNLNEPFQTYYINIRDENLWNLIEIDKRKYFVLVNWKSTSPLSSIENLETNLLQIEYLTE